MMRWLVAGEVLASYNDGVEFERAEMIRALEAGEIAHRLVFNGRIAVVESTHRAATSVGYAFAPVVVALNPEFRVSVGRSAPRPYRKFTICQFTTGHVDLRAVVTELASREPGWGGSPTIVGSPQGVGSTLTLDEVVDVVEKYLK